MPRLASTLRPAVATLLPLAVLAYGFFLALEFVSLAMKTTFSAPMATYFEQGGALSELGAFALGIVGTSLVQSSSTVTSVVVVLTQQGVLPLLVAVGIAHGANIGTSVTSSLVAFASEFRGTGRPLRDLRRLVTAPRSKGFESAVGAAVVHDFFNILMVTLLLLTLELPFGAIRGLASAGAAAVGASLSGSHQLLAVTAVLSPTTYTRPVADWLLSVGVPSALLLVVGLGLLFGSLKAFSRHMRSRVLHGDSAQSPEQLGARLLGRSGLSAFARGLLLTVVVQSSSATTSLIVPLAALGLFSLGRVLPFIMGANLGTTATALLAASAGLGDAGFHAGMTLALSHFLLNLLAVAAVALVPQLSHAIRAAASSLGASAQRRPYMLLLYLASLTLVGPALILMLPLPVGVSLLALVPAGLLAGPSLARRWSTMRVQGSLPLGRPPAPRSAAATPARGAAGKTAMRTSP